MIYFLDQIHTGVPRNIVSLPRSELLSESILFNCDAKIEKDWMGRVTPVGNPTEKCLINYLVEAGFNVENIFEQK